MKSILIGLVMVLGLVGNANAERLHNFHEPLFKNSGDVVNCKDPDNITYVKLTCNSIGAKRIANMNTALVNLVSIVIPTNEAEDLQEQKSLIAFISTKVTDYEGTRAINHLWWCVLYTDLSKRHVVKDAFKICSKPMSEEEVKK